MKHTVRSILICALALTALILGFGAAPASAVWNGRDASEVYPFLGAYKTEYPVPPGAGGNGCGVSVLAPDWGITAAHCLKNNDATAGSPKGWTVQLGSSDVTRGGDEVAVKRFFRLTAERPFGRDLMLLQFATPTLETPIPLATDVPAPGTPVRFLGWGSTCEPMTNDASCYPALLQEGDGEVAPIADCPSSDPTAGEICVRGRDGAQTGNADSGGPLLVKEGGAWRLAGILSGPETQGTDVAGLFTSVTRHREWIANTMKNASQIRDNDSGDPLAGYPSIGECTASVVESDSSRPDDPAMLLTNAHCLPVIDAEMKRPAPGEFRTDVPLTDKTVTFTDDGGYPLTTARMTRLIYATMTGTDVAVFALDKSFAELRAEGATVLQLAATAARPGDAISLRGGRTFACTVDAIVPRLDEAGYRMTDAIRYAADDGCAPYGGLSGAALLAADGVTVVGIHNTHNEEGKLCTENNPCEVDSSGAENAREGRAYGQQIIGLQACLTAGSTLNLDAKDCRLLGGAGDDRAVAGGLFGAIADVAIIAVIVLSASVLIVVIVWRRKRTEKTGAAPSA